MSVVILTGKVIYGFACESASSTYYIAVLWKAQSYDVFSYMSLFSTADYLWGNPDICLYDIDTIIGQRGIYLNGKLNCIR